MSDELDKAVADGDSTESTGATGEGRQSEGRVNLDDFPEFRRWKSEQDKRLAQMERQAQEATRRAAQIEQQRQQDIMAQMDDVERLRYQNKLYEQQLVEAEKRRQQDIVNWQKSQDIANVAQKLGLDRSELEQALPENADSYVLWEIALDMREKRVGPVVREREAARAATEQVHVPTGQKPPTKNKWEVMRDEAIKNSDVSKYLDAIAGAARDGIVIN